MSIVLMLALMSKCVDNMEKRQQITNLEQVPFLDDCQVMGQLFI